MNAAEGREVVRQLSGVRGELAALRRELASLRPPQHHVDLRPMRRVTAARLLMAMPGFVDLWKSRVPQERVVAACLMSARSAKPDAWAFFCRCGEQVVVPKGTVARCEEACGSWYLGIGDAVLVKRWERP